MKDERGQLPWSAVVLMAAVACGCAEARRGDATPEAGRVQAEAEAGGERADARPRKGRAQLWAENCQRCHNARPASWYSEREWEVAMHHMFVRGYLTRHEHDAIMEFFRASR